MCTNVHVQITRSVAFCFVRDDDNFQVLSLFIIRPCISCSSVSVDRDIAVGVAVGWRSGVRISVGARYSAPVHTGPGAHPASTTMGTVSLSRG